MSTQPQDPSQEPASVRPPRQADDLPAARRRTHARHRAVPARRTPLRSRRARFASVWPVAQTDPLPGTALLPGWLGRTLLTLVTGYTRPGHRVLLLTPPRRPRATPTGTTGVITGWFGTDEFAGLAEATWTLARLGRSLDTATATPPPDYLDDPAPATAGTTDRGADESESGPRPPHPETSARPDPDGRLRHGRHRDSADSSADSSRFLRGFDLIITAAHPHDTDWLRRTDWASLLTPNGLLAVVTYSDIRGLRMLDPIGAIVATFRNRGLWWWDQIALLTDPAATAPVAASNGTAMATAELDSGASDGMPLPVARTHHDLLLFLPAGPASPTGDTTTPTGRHSEERNTSDD